MKRILLTVAACLLTIVAKADEGMWLPSLISQRIADMQEKGFRLSAEDIYNVNQASLKDAVVLFGRGCTGELVSAEGLLITNHHCGYGQIQKHSSVEHDYLRDGFWAMTRDEELPNKGLTVSFLERMEDVTPLILKGVTSEMSEADRVKIVSRNSEALMDKVEKERKGIRATVEALYYGNQYFLFVYREYQDVRLVGAPPSSIGKFGGETDNWMWPRHTGDFSIFRIYADRNNDPAPYSKDNVPYTPKKYFKISTAGVHEGDFTFIYGFPGRTQEYIHSDAVRYIQDIGDPHKIMLRTKRLEIMNRYMGESQKVRIQYSAKKASVANAWKKWQGEVKGLKKMKTPQVKKQFETQFDNWAAGTQYEGITARLAGLYAELEPLQFMYDYYTEAIMACELLKYAPKACKVNEKTGLIDTVATKENAEAFFKDYHMPVDKETFAAMMKEFDRNVPEDSKPAYFKEQMHKYGSAQAWAEDLFASSIFTSLESVAGLDDLVLEDPAIELVSYVNEWIAPVRTRIREINQQLQLAYRDYMRGQMEYAEARKGHAGRNAFYPDANLTLRVAYGHIKGYSPADGAYYLPSSTIKGIMEKDNPDIFDYNIPQRLRDIYAAKDYGRWADESGEVPVCFIATNHTTGGNSGSPVINADGNLIGLNFDRVWEGTMSDIVFDPDKCRNIALDIRYVLFTIEKLAGASHLIDEMTLID